MAGISEQPEAKKWGVNSSWRKLGCRVGNRRADDMQIVSKKCRTTAGCLNYLFIRVDGGREGGRRGRGGGWEKGASAPGGNVPLK